MRLLTLVLALLSVGLGSCQNTIGCSSTTDLIFVLDSSGSLVENPDRAGNWNYIRQFVSTAITNLGNTVERRYPRASSGVRVALVQFAERAFMTFGLNTYGRYQEAANAVLSARNFGGSTNMAAALSIVEGLLQPQTTRNTIVVIVSDFKPNVDRNELFIAQRIKNRNNVKIVSVGVRGNVDEALLRQIASDNRVVLSENINTLLNHISPLIMVMCETIVRQPVPCAKDIVLVMDASISINTFNALKEFVALVAANLANADRNTRIGVVTFSDQAMVTSNLVPYSQSLSRQIVSALHRQALTNIGAGLRTANSLFNDRSRQRHVIVFTDGVATRDAGREATEASFMRSQGINIIAYGVGSMIDRGRLETLVAINQRTRNVIVNPGYSSTPQMISQINAVTSLAACPAQQPPPPCVEQQADVVLALDASGSIVDKGRDNWRRMQDFAAELIRQLVLRHPGIRIGALTFSENALWLSGLTNQYAGVTQAIRSALNQNSYTNQAAAFRMAMDILNRGPPIPGSSRQKYVIMVTDGEPTKEVGREISEAQNLRQNAITRILVGVTNRINRNNLYSIASRPDTVIYSENMETLNSVPMITAVVKNTINCPGGPARDIPSSQCFAADVIFAMDRSGSIEARTPGNFQRMKDFVSALATSLHQRYSDVRFGLVIFSDQADIISWLERYSNVQTFVNIIQSITYLGQRTNIAAAIRESRVALSRHSTKMPQIILITDGEATQDVGQEDREAQIARSFGIRLSAIAVTQAIHEDALIRLTGNRENVFRAPNFESIRRQIVSVTQVACKPVQESAVSCNGLPEIVFALDVSASITGDESRSAKQFIMNSIETFRQGNQNSRFGLVVFSTNARRIFGLESDLNYIRTLVNGLNNEQGRTNIAEGLERAAEVLRSARPNSNRIIILITDGLPNERIGQEVTVANSIKSARISIVPVGVTEYGPDYNALGRIATPNTVVKSLNFALLNMRIVQLTESACRPNNNVFIPQPQPQPFPQPQPERPPLPSFAAPAFNTPQRFPAVSCPGSHVVLLIDRSMRLNPNEGVLEQTKNLAASIVRYISSAKPGTKFAIITYTRTGKVEDSFSPSRSVNVLTHIISSIRLAHGSYDSNIARGLFAARNAIASRVNARTVHSYIILFSDGRSNVDSGIEFTEARIARSMGIRLMAVGVQDPSRSLLSLLIGENGDGSIFDATYNRERLPAEISRRIDQCGSADGPQVSFLRDSNSCPEEIVFVIDSGGNQTMNITNRKLSTNFMSSIVEEYARFYDVRGRFAAVQFSDRAEVAMSFSKDLPFVTYTLTHLKHLNYSNDRPVDMAKGLYLARELFEDSTKKKLVVVISDEKADEDGTQQILEEVQELSDKGIDLVVVGIAAEPRDDVFFEVIAGSLGGVVSVDRYDELKNEVNSVLKQTCNGQVTFRPNDQGTLTL